MRLLMSLLFFFIPAGLGLLGLYALLPVLERAGVDPLPSFLLSVVMMFPLLLAAALVAYHAEGRRFTWANIRSRFRLKRLSAKGWLWTAGLVVVYVGGQVLLRPTSRWLESHLPLPLPRSLPPAIDPRIPQTAIPTDFLGVPLRGNWTIGLLYVAIWVLNILGEELWWRGYVLPRQEMAHGSWTWLVHGALWTLFHVPFWWNLVTLLPSTLSLSYVTSRLRNTTPGIIAHAILNGLGMVGILLGVMGVGA
jgi:membrane protease YdiL (CAAX protease family)